MRLSFIVYYAYYLYFYLFTTTLSIIIVLVYDDDDDGYDCAFLLFIITIKLLMLLLRAGWLCGVRFGADEDHWECCSFLYEFLSNVYCMLQHLNRNHTLALEFACIFSYIQEDAMRLLLKFHNSRPRGPQLVLLLGS